MNSDKECVMIQLRNGERGRSMRNLGKGFLTGLGLLLMIMPVMAVFAATNVTGIDHSSTADGGVRIALQTSGDVPQVSVFATENPARIVLDLAETDNQAGTDAVSVGRGSVQQYSAVGAGGRTRLIVDLSQAANYDYSADAGQVVLTIAGSGETGSRPSQRSSGAAFNVTGVDFRRGEEGQSRVIIKLDRPGASMSVKEGSNTVSLDIFNSNLPESLDQQLDVVDFATPVQFIDSAQVNSAVRVILTTNGLYEHLAYESGNDIVVEVKQAQKFAKSKPPISNSSRKRPTKARK